MRPLRLGYVPLVHAAPLFVAAHQGFFEREGLRVRLSREIGWASLREKVLSGELDAAQALAPMPLAITLGLRSRRVDCLTGLVLTVHGNAIVLSRRLWSATGGKSDQLANARAERPAALALGIVSLHSTQHILLRDWCLIAGLVPERDFHLVVVPPPQMAGHLRNGILDGFCVGEPWAYEAVRTGSGVIAALSADLAPGHAEKVLLLRRVCAENRHPEHLALIRALFAACRWCAQTGNREELIRLLAHRGALGVTPEVLRPALTGDYPLGDGRHQRQPRAVVFHGDGINEPDPSRLDWLARGLGESPSPELLARVFRSDLFRAAIAPQGSPFSPQEPSHPISLSN